MQVGDEVIVEEKTGRKINTYKATVEGIYPHFVNIRHPNGYLVSISNDEVNKLIKLEGDEKMQESGKLPKDVLKEEMKTMSWEEIAKKHNIKNSGLVKGLAVRYGLIEGTGIYARKHHKDKEGKKMSNFLRPTAFTGKSGMEYEIRPDDVRIMSGIDDTEIVLTKKCLEIFAQEINELNEYLKMQK